MSLTKTCPTCGQKTVDRKQALVALRGALNDFSDCDPGGCEFCVETGCYYEGGHPVSVIAEAIGLGKSVTYSLLCEAAREGWAQYEYASPKEGPRARVWYLREQK